MESPHRQAWRETLRKQYEVAVADGDNVDGMTRAMEMAGFDENELAQLRVKANMTNVDIEPDFNEARRAFGIEDEPEPAGIDNCHTPSKPKKRVAPRIRKPRKGGA